jgi:SAM-dependent methyltransferase
MIFILPMAKSERDWEEHYLENHTPWDHGAPSPALVEILDKGELSAESEVLVPGCGYGHDVGALVAAGCIATGLDIASSAVAGAKRFNPHERADYLTGDFFTPTWSEGRCYDAIWEHTCFCAIRPEQRNAYIESAHQLLKPGGVLLGVFFAFSDDPDAEGPPFKTDIPTLHRHFEHRFTLEWERHPERSFPSREGQEWLMCWRKKEQGQ